MKNFILWLTITAAAAFFAVLFGVAILRVLAHHGL